MSKFKILPVVVSAMAGAIAAPVFAGPQPVSLSPITHAPAELVIAGRDGEHRYSPASLEALGAQRMVTITPWREEAATFEGVLLTDLLDAHGLSDVDAIRVTAENDYAVVIPADVWRNWDVLVATRVNGRPHSRRERGPIQFVFPMSDDRAAGTGEVVNHWVWMAARIEAAN